MEKLELLRLPLLRRDVADLKMGKKAARHALRPVGNVLRQRSSVLEGPGAGRAAVVLLACLVLECQCPVSQRQ